MRVGGRALAVVVAAFAWGCAPAQDASLDEAHASAIRDSVMAMIGAYSEAVEAGGWRFLNGHTSTPSQRGGG